MDSIYKRLVTDKPQQIFMLFLKVAHALFVAYYCLLLSSAAISQFSFRGCVDTARDYTLRIRDI